METPSRAVLDAPRMGL